jgi:hypothetical protein
MPKQRKPPVKKTGWVERIPGGVTFASSVIGLLSAAAGLWLLWPRIEESFDGPKYQIAYDYVVATDPGLSCVAKHDATLKIGDKSIGLLQNDCQKKVIAGVAHNDVFRIWYVRVVNTGPEIPKVSVVQSDGASDFNLPAGDVTLVCLGYKGRAGREGKEWNLVKLEFSNGNGKIQRTIAARKAPTDEQLKSTVSNCAETFVGYPPL